MMSVIWKLMTVSTFVPTPLVDIYALVRMAAYLTMIQLHVQVSTLVKNNYGSSYKLICAFVFKSHNFHSKSHFIDIDECLAGLSNCEHLCDNLYCTQGKYKCLCHEGYQLNNDGYSCKGLSDTSCLLNKMTAF